MFLKVLKVMKDLKVLKILKVLKVYARRHMFQTCCSLDTPLPKQRTQHRALQTEQLTFTYPTHSGQLDVRIAFHGIVLELSRQNDEYPREDLRSHCPRQGRFAIELSRQLRRLSKSPVDLRSHDVTQATLLCQERLKISMWQRPPTHK